MELIIHSCGERLWRHETANPATIVIYGAGEEAVTAHEVHTCPGCGASLADSDCTDTAGRPLIPRAAYPRPVDHALGRGVPDEWKPDGMVVFSGRAHEVSIVQIEGDRLFVSGLTYCGWIPSQLLIREAD